MVEAMREGDIPGVQLRYRMRLECSSPAKLWGWLTDPEKQQIWLADKIEREASSPLSLILTSSAPTGRSVERIHTLAFDAPTSWTFDLVRKDEVWRSSTRVTLTVATCGNECELSVFHRGFQNLSLSSCLSVWEEYRRRWVQAFARLEKALSLPDGLA